MSANGSEYSLQTAQLGDGKKVYDDEEDTILTTDSMVICNEMCIYCFDVLISYFTKQNKPIQPRFPDNSFPLFVSWSIGREKRLRGCIGTFNPIGLHDGLQDYALKSALEDSRFSPIESDELPRLHVSVSILRHFEEGSGYLDWEIGIHGIRIEFISEHGYKRTATYLPEVAPEQGWNHVQTIDSLLRKGGFRGQINQNVRNAIKLTRYQTEKLSLSYPEYKEFRKILM